MGMATFTLCYNNYRVFRTTVRIPKGEALKIMQTADCYESVMKLALEYCKKLKVKAEKNIKKNPNEAASKEMISLMIDLIQRCEKPVEKWLITNTYHLSGPEEEKL